MEREISKVNYIPKENCGSTSLKQAIKESAKEAGFIYEATAIAVAFTLFAGAMCAGLDYSFKKEGLAPESEQTIIYQR